MKFCRTCKICIENEDMTAHFRSATHHRILDNIYGSQAVHSCRRCCLYFTSANDYLNHQRSHNLPRSSQTSSNNRSNINKKSVTSSPLSNHSKYSWHKSQSPLKVNSPLKRVTARPRPISSPVRKSQSSSESSKKINSSNTPSLPRIRSKLEKSKYSLDNRSENSVKMNMSFDPHEHDFIEQNITPRRHYHFDNEPAHEQHLYDYHAPLNDDMRQRQQALERPNVDAYRSTSSPNKKFIIDQKPQSSLSINTVTPMKKSPSTSNHSKPLFSAKELSSNLTSKDNNIDRKRRSTEDSDSSRKTKCKSPKLSKTGSGRDISQTNLSPTVSKSIITEQVPSSFSKSGCFNIYSSSSDCSSVKFSQLVNHPVSRKDDIALNQMVKSLSKLKKRPITIASNVHDRIAVDQTQSDLNSPQVLPVNVEDSGDSISRGTNKEKSLSKSTKTKSSSKKVLSTKTASIAKKLSGLEKNEKSGSVIRVKKLTSKKKSVSLKKPKLKLAKDSKKTKVKSSRDTKLSNSVEVPHDQSLNNSSTSESPYLPSNSVQTPPHLSYNDNVTFPNTYPPNLPKSGPYEFNVPKPLFHNSNISSSIVTSNSSIASLFSKNYLPKPANNPVATVLNISLVEEDIRNDIATITRTGLELRHIVAGYISQLQQLESRRITLLQTEDHLRSQRIKLLQANSSSVNQSNDTIVVKEEVVSDNENHLNTPINVSVSKSSSIPTNFTTTMVNSLPVLIPATSPSSVVSNTSQPGRSSSSRDIQYLGCLSKDARMHLRNILSQESVNMSGMNERLLNELMKWSDDLQVDDDYSSQSSSPNPDPNQKKKPSSVNKKKSPKRTKEPTFAIDKLSTVPSNVSCTSYKEISNPVNMNESYKSPKNILSVSPLISSANSIHSPAYKSVLTDVTEEVDEFNFDPDLQSWLKNLLQEPPSDVLKEKFDASLVRHRTFHLMSTTQSSITNMAISRGSLFLIFAGSQCPARFSLMFERLTLYEYAHSSPLCLLVSEVTECIYIGHAENKLSVHYIFSGRLANAIGLAAPCLCMVSDGRCLYVGLSNGMVMTCSIARGKAIRGFYVTGNAVRSLVCAREGPRQLLCAACDDSNIYIMQASTGLLCRTLSGHKLPATNILVVGTVLFSGSDDFTVMGHDYQTGDEVVKWSEASAEITGLGYLTRATERFVVVSSADRFIRLYNTSNYSLQYTLYGARCQPVTSLIVHNDKIISTNSGGFLEEVSVDILSSYPCRCSCDMLFGLSDDLICHIMETHVRKNEHNSFSCPWLRCNTSESSLSLMCEHLRKQHAT